MVLMKPLFLTLQFSFGTTAAEHLWLIFSLCCPPSPHWCLGSVGKKSLWVQNELNFKQSILWWCQLQHLESDLSCCATLKQLLENSRLTSRDRNYVEQRWPHHVNQCIYFFLHYNWLCLKHMLHFIADTMKMSRAPRSSSSTPPGSEGWWSRWDPGWGGDSRPLYHASPCFPGALSAPWETAGPCPHSLDSEYAYGLWWAVAVRSRRRRKIIAFKLIGWKKGNCDLK